MLPRERVLEEVRVFAQRLSDAIGTSLVAVALIGSYARNEQGKRSDIDVLVVIDDVRPQTLRKVRSVSKASHFYPKIVSNAELATMPARYRVGLLDAEMVWNSIEAPSFQDGELICHLQDRLYRIGAKARRIFFDMDTRSHDDCTLYFYDLLKRCVSYMRLKFLSARGRCSRERSELFEVAERQDLLAEIVRWLNQIRNDTHKNPDWYRILTTIDSFQLTELAALRSVGFRESFFKA